jgi:hypothetical protein
MSFMLELALKTGFSLSEGIVDKEYSWPKMASNQPSEAVHLTSKSEHFHIKRNTPLEEL